MQIKQQRDATAHLSEWPPLGMRTTADADLMGSWNSHRCRWGSDCAASYEDSLEVSYQIKHSLIL